MPQGLVQAYVTMLPRLEAEEQIARVNATGLALGDPESDDLRAERNRLHASALPVQTSAPKPKSPEALAALGFAVRRVPVRRRKKVPA